MGLGHLRSAVASITEDLELTRSVVDDYASGAQSIPPLDGSGPDLQHVANCLKVIEGCLHSRLQEDTIEVMREDIDNLAQGLVALGVYAEISLMANPSPYNELGECLCSTIRG